jgi:hypothetical protein
MTPRLPVETVQVSMLSTKWILWAELALPRAGHKAKTKAAMGKGICHSYGAHH